MPSQIVKMRITESIFEGLAKQNLRFHNCVAELVDNAIAAHKSDSRRFKVEIFIREAIPGETIDLYIVDYSGGMSFSDLRKGLQLGGSVDPPDSRNFLNEHGFGLKNSLATLSNNNGFWKLWTVDKKKRRVLSVEGPYKPNMKVELEDQFPDEHFLPKKPSTVIKVSPTIRFFQSVQGLGTPSPNLLLLSERLVEHLGVFYRGYLEKNSATNKISGSITVYVGDKTYQVAPVPVPILNPHTETLRVSLGNKKEVIKYTYGTLAKPVDKRKKVRGLEEGTKFYYQGNTKSQGIDIRLGNRTIATRQLESIWKSSDDPSSELSRHGSYNEFVGELCIPVPKSGTLTTVNNKSAPNESDAGWQTIFKELNDRFPPIRKERQREEDIKPSELILKIQKKYPDDEIAPFHKNTVWNQTGYIDVYRKTKEGEVIIYELKLANLRTLDLYQLKMYWDGLVMQGESPIKAILLCDCTDPHHKLKIVASKMNRFPPYGDSNPYNFKVLRHPYWDR